MDVEAFKTRLEAETPHYKPISRVAIGGMAEIWAADAEFESGVVDKVAIKRVRPELATQPIYHAMFEDEARLGMMLDHPNIVHVFDARDVGDAFIMVMEYVDGTSLKDLMQRAHDRGAPMPPATALFILVRLAMALGYAHHLTDPEGNALNIIHRDVSPHNLLLGRNGSVKLLDFGLSDASLHEAQLGQDMLGGKLAYLAPEVVRQQPHDHRVDLFAMGIVLWEMLCGRPLFQGKDDQATLQAVSEAKIPDARDFNPAITPATAQCLEQLLQADPEKRYSSTAEAEVDLRMALREIDQDERPTGVSLLVGLHMSSAAFMRPEAPAALADALLHELDAFVEAEEQAPVDGGSAPLDPSSFKKKWV